MSVTPIERDRPMPPIARRVAGPMLAASAVLAGLLLASPVAAERADRDKPTNVESDNLQYDDTRQTTVFNGKVVLTKGTIVIRGDRLVLRQVAEGEQSAVATGRPASFRQKRDGVDQHIQGVGQSIEYDSRAEKVTLTGSAMLSRLECGRAIDQITGAVIVYDGRSETFNVDGKPGGRVRVTIQPRGDAPGSRNGEAKAAAPCPPGAPTELKAAPRIATPRPDAPAVKP